MKKKILILLAATFVASTLTACGGVSMKCRSCGKESTEVYIDVNGTAVLCKDCAVDYWAPFDISAYKLTNEQKKKMLDK